MVQRMGDVMAAGLFQILGAGWVRVSGSNDLARVCDKALVGKVLIESMIQKKLSRQVRALPLTHDSA